MEEIRAQALVVCPTTCLEASQRAKEAQKVVNARNKKTTYILHRHPTISPPTNPSPSSPTLKIHKLTHAEMTEHQLKGLCYNCDKKYFHGHNLRRKYSLWPFQRTFWMMKLHLSLNILYLNPLMTFLPLLHMMWNP
jgi:hypothetical protein